MSWCSRGVRVADIGGTLGPTVARVLYHQEALRAIAAAFEDRRISFILLKGEALSKVLYPQAAGQYNGERKKASLSDPGEAKQVGEAAESRDGLESGPC